MYRPPYCPHLTYRPPYCHQLTYRPLYCHQSQCWLSSSAWPHERVARPSALQISTHIPSRLPDDKNFKFKGTAAGFWLATGRLPHVTASPICIQSVFCYHIVSSWGWFQICLYGIRGGKDGTSNTFASVCPCHWRYIILQMDSVVNKTLLLNPPIPPKLQSLRKPTSTSRQPSSNWHKPTVNTIPRAQTF